MPATAMTRPTALPPPVVEIERRLHWRVLSLAGFLALMITFAVMAAISVLVPARLVTGLPDDPEMAAVRADLRGLLPMRAGELRFRSALAGEAPPGAVFDAGTAARVERARPQVERVRDRRRGDTRLEVALAHLDLALQRYLRAETRYRAVTDRGADVPEAHLGLGVALALQAAAETDQLRAHALRLEAIGQLTAVNRRDEAYEPALYDRALLLEEVGRRAEAARCAREHLALDPTGPWAARMQGIAEAQGR